MTKDQDTISPQEKPPFWKDHIQACKKSGLSGTEYCRKNNLKPNRFWYWKKRIEKPAGNGVNFVPLRMPVGRISQSLQTTTLVTPNGYRIELADGFDPAMVRQLIQSISDL